MIPDLATVLRRRHTMIIIIRCAIAVAFAYSAVQLFQLTVGLLVNFQVLSVGMVVGAVLQEIHMLVLGVVLLIFQKPIARLLIPLGTRVDQCMNCGYPLKNLRSAICPECGVGIRHASPQSPQTPAALVPPPTPPPPPGFPRS